MKYSGEIGYYKEIDKGYGVWVKETVVKKVKGDLIQYYKADENDNKINQDYQIRNRISVVASDDLYNSVHQILYITFKGVKYKVKNVEVKQPRLIISIGEEYIEG